jgi:hypothetical protein
MVVVFQPIGTIIGWADYNACQPFQGSYQLLMDRVDQDEPFRFDFVWNQWKTQPFSSCTSTTTTIATTTPTCEEHEMDAFWYILSSSVTSLLLTGHSTIELQNRDGDTVVRLQAVAGSYHCDNNSMPGSSTLRPDRISETASCDPEATNNLGLSQSSLRDYLAMGNDASALDGTLQESSGYLFASKNKLSWLLELTLVVAATASSSFFVL